MSCSCFIIPPHVLERLSKDSRLTGEQRKALADAARFERQWRKVRTERTKLTALASLLPSEAFGAEPHFAVFTCNHGTTLPGTPAPTNDASAGRALEESKGVAAFFKTVFGRNSVDGNGASLISSVHYGVRYNNAFWNGSQMAYGDGDGSLFVDFTLSKDVIGHELTHGVTQYTAQLAYDDEPGGLNESMSDVFGSMYRQWRGGPVDWRIGSDIMGPQARAYGYECLRDLSNPAAPHCLSPQPTHFDQYRNGMDPHESSGIPNFAFYKAATTIGGDSWGPAGKVWYAALTEYGPKPNLSMKAFADRTREKALEHYAAQREVHAAVDQAWKDVGL